MRPPFTAANFDERLSNRDRLYSFRPLASGKRHSAAGDGDVPTRPPRGAKQVDQPAFELRRRGVTMREQLDKRACHVSTICPHNDTKAYLVRLENIPRRMTRY